MINFDSARGGAVEGETAPLTVNLRLEGRNYLAGHSHPGLKGNATVNLSAAPGSYTVFTSEYASTPEAVSSALTLNKIGTYDVKVNNQTADLDAAKSAKPLVITGQDPVEIVKATIDALPAAADVTPSHRDAITAARAAYDALSAEKQASFDATALQHLTDDEAALAATESAATENVPSEEPAKNLTALWVILAFAAGAAVAVAVMTVIAKKKTPQTPHEAKTDEGSPSPGGEAGK